MIFMNKKNLFLSDKKGINELYFDGKVNIREVYGERDFEDNELYYVEFFEGALTTLHYHETAQTLIPQYGKGIVGEIGKLTSDSDLPFKINPDDISIQFLEVGDVVVLPKNTYHFHGALPNQTFSHIAFRKTYEPLCSNNQVIYKQTNTKWIYDLLSSKLPNDVKKHNTILDYMNEISSVIKKAIEIKCLEN